MSIKDRILQIMEHEGLSSSRFAEAIGIQRAAMSHITSGRNNPSLDVLIKVLERFTYVAPDWLLFGKGEMRREQQPQSPDLFTNALENSPEVQNSQEKREEMRVETPQIATKPTVIEKVVCQEKPSKLISKIMVFYSDNTFDTFVPEKNKKD